LNSGCLGDRREIVHVATWVTVYYWVCAMLCTLAMDSTGTICSILTVLIYTTLWQSLFKANITTTCST